MRFHICLISFVIAHNNTKLILLVPVEKKKKFTINLEFILHFLIDTMPEMVIKIIPKPKLLAMCGWYLLSTQIPLSLAKKVSVLVLNILCCKNSVS